MNTTNIEKESKMNEALSAALAFVMTLIGFVKNVWAVALPAMKMLVTVTLTVAGIFTAVWTIGVIEGALDGILSGAIEWAGDEAGATWTNHPLFGTLFSITGFGLVMGLGLGGYLLHKFIHEHKMRSHNPEHTSYKLAYAHKLMAKAHDLQGLGMDAFERGHEYYTPSTSQTAEIIEVLEVTEPELANELKNWENTYPDEDSELTIVGAEMPEGQELLIEVAEQELEGTDEDIDSVAAEEE